MTSQNIILVSGGLVFVAIWVAWLIKVPRLEVTAEGIRYVGFGGYSPKSTWHDVERLDSWGDGFTKERGLISRKQNFHRAWWMTPFYDENGDNKGILSKYPKVINGIPLEPMFAENIFDSELGGEIRRHAPQIFTH